MRQAGFLVEDSHGAVVLVRHHCAFHNDIILCRKQRVKLLLLGFRAIHQSIASIVRESVFVNHHHAASIETFGSGKDLRIGVEMHRQIRISKVFFQFGATRIGKHHEIAGHCDQ